MAGGSKKWGYRGFYRDIAPRLGKHLDETETGIIADYRASLFPKIRSLLIGVPRIRIVLQHIKVYAEVPYLRKLSSVLVLRVEGSMPSAHYLAIAIN